MAPDNEDTTNPDGKALVEVDPNAAVTITLSGPIKSGKDELTELVLKPTARAFRDTALEITESGGVVYKPYALARVGVQLAGLLPGMVDRLNVRDMNKIAQAVMRFLS